MKWFKFCDMHTRGRLTNKPYEFIFIEAEEILSAIEVFDQRFKQSPYSSKCPCCGCNYTIMEYSTLEAATMFEWVTSQTTHEQFIASDCVLIIPKESHETKSAMLN